MLEELPPELPEVELDGLEDEPLAPDGLELMVPLELEPEELPCSLFSWACHSERLICPSWFLSILSNSLLELEEDEPPAEELLGLVVDDVLPCDMEGEDPALDFEDESPSANAAAAKASNEKLRNRGLINFMQISP